MNINQPCNQNQTKLREDIQLLDFIIFEKQAIIIFPALLHDKSKAKRENQIAQKRFQNDFSKEREIMQLAKEKIASDFAMSVQHEKVTTLYTTIINY